MAYIPKNFEVLGLLLLLTAAGGRFPASSSGPSGSSGLPGISGLSALFRPAGLSGPLQFGVLSDFARDMHRMVDVMDQMAGVGQMLMPRDSSHVAGAASAVSSAVSSALSSASAPGYGQPDLQQIMEMAGPLMNILGMDSFGKK